MNRYSVDEFVSKTQQEDKGEGLFEMETPRLLEVNLDGKVWAKAGSMVSYRGRVKFKREGVFEHGIGRMVKKCSAAKGSPDESGRKRKGVSSGSGKEDIHLKLER